MLDGCRSPATASSTGRRPCPTRPRPRATAAGNHAPAADRGAVADVWRDVLGVDGVDADDNFFALGGDSIRSLKVVARLRRQAGYRRAANSSSCTRPCASSPASGWRSWPPRPEGSASAFGLLSAADAGARSEATAWTVTAGDGPHRGRLSAGLTAGRHALPRGVRGRTATYHDCTTVTLRGTVRRRRRSSARWRSWSPATPVLRTSFDLTDFSEPVQLVHPGAAIPLGGGRPDAGWRARPRRRGWSGSGATRSSSARSTGPRPPLAARLRPPAAGRSTFALTLSFHHAILDGWSVASLVTDLLRRYPARLDGTTLPAVRPAARYRDFVAGERAALAAPRTSRSGRSRSPTPRQPAPGLPGFPRADGERLAPLLGLGDQASRGSTRSRPNCGCRCAPCCSPRTCGCWPWSPVSRM